MAFVDDVVTEVLVDFNASRQERLMAALVIVARDLHKDAIKEVALSLLCGDDESPKMPFKIEFER